MALTPVDAYPAGNRKVELGAAPYRIDGMVALSMVMVDARTEQDGMLVIGFHLYESPPMHITAFATPRSVDWLVAGVLPRRPVYCHRRRSSVVSGARH
jgi:hypothetical protein